MPVAIIPDIMDDGSEACPSDYVSRCTQQQQQQQQQQQEDEVFRSRACHQEQLLLQRQREREGRCGECGVQTHQFQTDPLTYERVKVPLTIDKEVHRGRCLLCHPLFFLPANSTTVINSQQPSPPTQQEAQQPQAMDCQDFSTESRALSVESSSSTAAETAQETIDESLYRLSTRRQRQPPTQHSAQRSRLSPRAARSLYMTNTKYTKSPTTATTYYCPMLDGDDDDDVCNHRLGCCRRTTQGYCSCCTCSPTWDDDPFVREALEIMESPSSAFDIVDLLMVMKRLPHNVRVQERGCERLWILSWDDENAFAIGRVGGIAILLNAMTRFPIHTHIQQCACECLQNLAADSSDYNRIEICELRGVELIVQAMMRHPKVASLQACGCMALANLASPPTSPSGIKASSLSFQRHLQQHQNIYHPNQHQSIRYIRSLIQHAYGLEAILRAGYNFAHDDGVIEAVKYALVAMGYDASGRVSPMRSSGNKGT